MWKGTKFELLGKVFSTLSLLNEVQREGLKNLRSPIAFVGAIRQWKLKSPISAVHHPIHKTFKPAKMLLLSDCRRKTLQLAVEKGISEFLVPPPHSKAADWHQCHSRCVVLNPLKINKPSYVIGQA